MPSLFKRGNHLIPPWLLLAVLGELVVAQNPAAASKKTPMDVVNVLFECHLANRKLDVLYHQLLKDINLEKGQHTIPGIALCSIKRTEPGKASERKRFIKSIASVVNRVNSLVMGHRLFVLAVRHKTMNNLKLTAEEKEKFQLICSFYQSNDIKTLLERIGPVPVSLAVAQASLESGFGSSVVLHRNNAFFGMMKDKRSVYYFDTLFEAVIAYVKTINVHPCYKQLQQERTKMLLSAQKIDGTKLVQYLGKYAEKKNYRSNLSKIMEYHNLHLLDRSYKNV
ncbi:MAG: glucosaminidase domain-containing protein [Holosporaceae bacterium]|jgi:Bax protein|nr:glucosaminidase domain-containing protein [Holosporaceae bacterium]